MNSNKCFDFFGRPLRQLKSYHICDKLDFEKSVFLNWVFILLSNVNQELHFMNSGRNIWENKRYGLPICASDHLLTLGYPPQRKQNTCNGTPLQGAVPWTSSGYLTLSVLATLGGYTGRDSYISPFVLEL